jgi:hypothetical protein
MKDKIKLGIISSVAVVAFSAAPALAVPSTNGDDNPHNQVTICHATGSQSNPYVQNSPNANGNVSGHDNHGGDIIPPFTYNDNGDQKQYPGKNWDSEHQSIYNNGCKAGGQGGGSSQTETTTTQVATNNTTQSGGQAAAAVTQAPQAVAAQGGVSAGEGGAKTTSAGAVVGLLSSVGAIVAGGARLVVSKKLF